MYAAPLSASVPNAPASPGAADDDVPLARQIPTALKAQRTIRRQVRDELDQKRQERRAARAQQALLAQPQPPRALSSAAETAPPPFPPTGSSPPRPGGRPRTRTLPSTVSSPFSVGDLTKKLLGLQAAPTAPATAPPMPPATARSKRPSLEAHDQHGYASASASASSARGRTMTVDPHTYTASSSRAASRPPAPEAGRSLRPMRSFHRPRTGDADAYIPPPIPTTSERTSADLQRRATAASRHRPEEPPAFLSTAPAPPDPRTVAALDRARSLRSAKSSSSRRPSLEKAQRPEPESISASRARAASSSAAAAAAAVPSPASTFAQPAGKGAGQMMWQQRVFIGNMQRFCLVEIGSGTSAGDVLGMVDAQGALDQGAGSGGWMLWEVSQDFGMERPIRSFEMLSDVCGAWNTDKTVNLLVIKKTLLAPLLNPKAMPSASPMCSGYVQWEYKRGKWQKRWMELREHSLWLSKRDTGKDATFLCSLNNFDAYYVTRVHKAPKPYVFSVKSTDSLSFFESTSDYVHVFSCGEGEGKNWLEKILLARSYVLYQERNVLSSQSAPGTAAAAAGGLQRSGTRKQAPGQRPAQPLVNVGAPKADPLSVPSGFEPAAGSLLARRHG
ncbi:hypothetical protein GY45DRAFT_1250692 [Cubamyces sp. BRFM 1775]|nr:hypothetical protein GY45DRAFT_1250692 [Cubamyces sp. BRFM 1775]